MGVPRLFPWLQKNFPEFVKRFNGSNSEKRFVVDNLYLDANAILHGAAQTIYNYGENKRKIDPHVNDTDEQKRTKTFELFFNTIQEIVKIVRPHKLLYIAIDGPAPLAKQAQQRQRRFLASLSRLPGGFDTNSITPGTIWMKELTEFIRTSIRKKVMSEWKAFSVIFSPPTYPGEGEHKCLQHIRENLNANKEVNCIYGPDGDLVMLALAAHVENMFLFKEDQYDLGYYYYVDMGGVRKKLPQILGFNMPAKDNTIRRNVCSNDFILLGFFVGNDFLPKIQMFMYLEDGLVKMLELLTNLLQGKIPENMISPNTEQSEKGQNITLLNDGQASINFESFAAFVKLVSKFEIQFLIDQTNHPLPTVEKKGEKNFKNKGPPDDRFKNETLLKCITEVDGEKKLDFRAYRVAYYKKMDVDANNDLEVAQVCMDYLRAIIWVFTYYVNKLESWTYFYNRHYAPLMSDLSPFLNKMTPQFFDKISQFELDVPPLPFIQLLSVLPPPSHDLLPPPFHPLLISPDSKFVKSGMYPSEIVLDFEGKTKEHMAVVLLPFIDIQLIREEYAKVAKILKNKYVRNTIVDNIDLFIHDPNYLATYTSKYGNIENLKVRKLQS